MSSPESEVGAVFISQRISGLHTSMVIFRSSFLVAMIIYHVMSSSFHRSRAIIPNSWRGITRSCTHLRAARFIDAGPEGIETCAKSIHNGGLVAFPTETVYGLGANAFDMAAVESIFMAKARPHTDPLIVHVLGKERIHDLFDFGDDSGKAKRVCEALVDEFWPGPLTLVYKASEKVPSLVTAHTGFVGLRSPHHEIARSLLRSCDPVPIAAPSANKFGHVSPTRSAHVMTDLGDTEGLLILEDEKRDEEDERDEFTCAIGIESTVCSVSPRGDRVTILRCGAVGSHAMRAALLKGGVDGVDVSIKNGLPLDRKDTDTEEPAQGGGEIGATAGAIAPGQLVRHYAPNVDTFVISSHTRDVLERPSGADGTHHSHRATKLLHEGASVVDFHGQLSRLRRSSSTGKAVGSVDGVYYRDLSPSGDVHEACRVLFSVLREAEEAGRTLLLPDLRRVAMVKSSGRQEQEMVRALWERLLRAASGEIL